MAYKGKTIRNPQTGQSIRFLQTEKDTGGRLLEMESALRPGSQPPPMHYHPAQSEWFTFLEGTVTVRTASGTRTYGAGDTLQVPAGRPHAMWNEGEVPAKMRWRVEPALDTEYLLETTMGLAGDGRTNRSGMPGLLQTALLLRRFAPVYRPAGPPFLLLQLLFSFLAPIAYLRGLRPTYRKYLD
ncbi:MAG TPA: cupin domain-containing protein [Chitinophagaceae bacterium]|jgi:quercetin dioxygenase-like cupin family protein|nr:cupin domain-containing protein [Chitinophagaceae bacterium]